METTLLLWCAYRLHLLHNRPIYYQPINHLFYLVVSKCGYVVCNFVVVVSDGREQIHANIQLSLPNPAARTLERLPSVACADATRVPQQQLAGHSRTRGSWRVTHMFYSHISRRSKLYTFSLQTNACCCCSRDCRFRRCWNTDRSLVHSSIQQYQQSIWIKADIYRYWLQGGLKNRGHKLIAIILSNLNRFSNFLLEIPWQICNKLFIKITLLIVVALPCETLMSGNKWLTINYK